MAGSNSEIQQFPHEKAPVLLPGPLDLRLSVLNTYLLQMLVANIHAGNSLSVACNEFNHVHSVREVVSVDCNDVRTNH